MEAANVARKTVIGYGDDEIKLNGMRHARSSMIAGILTLIASVPFYAYCNKIVTLVETTSLELAFDIRRDSTVEVIGGWNSADIATILESYAMFSQLCILSMAVLLVGIGFGMVYHGYYLRKIYDLLHERT